MLWSVINIDEQEQEDGSVRYCGVHCYDIVLKNALIGKMRTSVSINKTPGTVAVVNFADDVTWKADIRRARPQTDKVFDVSLLSQ